MKQLFTLLFFLPAFCLAQTPSVTITSVSSSSVCLGGRITVTYTSEGNFTTYAALYIDQHQIGLKIPARQSDTITADLPLHLVGNGQFTLRVQRSLSGTNLPTIATSPPIAITVYSPPQPTIITSLQYCLGDVATVSLANSVTATGPIKWYINNNGTPPLAEAPVVSASAVGNTSFFVSQTVDGCESSKGVVTVSVSNCNLQNGFFVGSGVGTKNTFLGAFAGRYNTLGTSNTFLGYQAGYNNTTASANVFIGNQAGYTNTTGISNLFLGSQAGANSNGSYNLFMGNVAGGLNTAGEGNTAIGDGAFNKNTTGNNNTAIGRYAGINNIGGTLNTFIGVGASNTSGSANLTNATAIGYNAFVSASNAMVLGNNSVNVGIGNSAPNNKLEITKGAANQSGLRFTNLTSASPATLLNQSKFLAVNENGDVVMASVNSTAREGVAETLWQRKGLFLQNTQNEAVVIGANVSRTPSGYKLFVEDGILTEKVKVAVKNTSEWSDYVFDKGYTLKSLSEVEQYIQTHAHLPGIPSATEVVEKGIDVAKMDATLLEKIEELTLYSIQQQKENQALKAEMIQQNQQHRKEIDELKALMKQVLEKK